MPAVVPPHPRGLCQGLGRAGARGKLPELAQVMAAVGMQRAGRTCHPLSSSLLIISTDSPRDWEAFDILCLRACTCSAVPASGWFGSLSQSYIHGSYWDSQPNKSNTKQFLPAKHSPLGLKAAVPEQAGSLNQDLPRKPSISYLLLLFVKTTEK